MLAPVDRTVRPTMRAFFLCSYFVTQILCIPYFERVDFSVLGAAVFAIAVSLVYVGLYLLPAFIVTHLARLVLLGDSPDGEQHRWRRIATFAIAAASTTLIEVAIYADRTLYGLFGFHLNGFVVNLLLTPGGIESMGESATSVAIHGARVAGILIVNVALLMTCRRLVTTELPVWHLPLPRPRVLGAAFLVLAMGQSAYYGVNDVLSNWTELAAANNFPFYQKVRLHKVVDRLGLDRPRAGEGEGLDLEGSRLAYPRVALSVDRAKHPPNVVWLVAESLRADMLDQEIMPRTWKFAERSQSFSRHYSGGNSTRMGMFSMFYGLPGTEWFSFLEERRGPVVMDVMKQLEYQFFIHTSARFSYPEFDKTIFAEIPERLLHHSGRSLTNSGEIGPGWEHDRMHVAQLIESMEGRDPARPFMTFMFFESPHASYYFPEESAIRKPYLEEFDYATMDLDEDMSLIKNRYINACHHLDQQIGRVLDYLERDDLVRNTIVIVTGDHGEEFMEKGRWGHNSEFHEEQILVPLVLSVPDAPARHVETMTSHLDLVATLLPELGVENPPQDYCMGQDLQGTSERHVALVADWSRLGIVDDSYKLTVPVGGSGMSQGTFTDLEDVPVNHSNVALGSHYALLRNVIHEVARFHSNDPVVSVSAR